MFNITSIFKNGSEIPDKYGCKGRDVNPPLNISEIPEGALSLALIVDDPDAPSGDWVHWLVYNIDPKTSEIKEDSIPSGAIVGLNSYGNNNYEGPCPPRATHHYYYKVYALNVVLDIPSSSEKSDLLKAIQGNVVDQAELMGTYTY